MQEVAHRLKVTYGTVFRNITSIYSAENLKRENHGGHIFYRSKISYIQTIFDHMMEFYRDDDLAEEE